MYGLQAISEANGWSMALAGAIIVFTGLSVLSFAISQIHKLVDMWENRGKTPASAETAVTDEPAAPRPLEIPQQWPADIHAAALIYHPLVTTLGERFELTALHQACRQHQFPHPHITITALRGAGYLTDTDTGKGVFQWNPDPAA